MVRNDLIKQIEVDFEFTHDNQKILGIILFGSYVTNNQTEKSDIDICIVAPRTDLYQVHKYIYENLTRNLDKYDIRFFEELPLYIQGEIIEKGMIILTQDTGALTEYLYRFRKQWEYEKWRLIINQ